MNAREIIQVAVESSSSPEQAGKAAYEAAMAEGYHITDAEGIAEDARSDAATDDLNHFACPTCGQTCQSTYAAEDCTRCQAPMDLVKPGEKAGGMTLEEARAYLEARGLEAFISGGADTIAKMQGIDRLR